MSAKVWLKSNVVKIKPFGVDSTIDGELAVEKLQT
jgi:hypothetical protein